MNSFGFGLWVGFVAGVVFAALWNSEPDPEPSLVVEEPSADTVIVVEEPPQEIDVVEIPTSEFQAEQTPDDSRGSDIPES